MKRQLTVALGLVVIATPAFATKARMEALGEDNFGSYYINDNRNIFLNPARINENKDFVTYEFGASGRNIAGPDTAASPRAGGGFAKSHGNMVYGLHFGDSSPNTSLMRAVTGSNLQERQPWDLFIGGDAGMKWGASFTYEQHDGGSTGNGDRLASHGMRVRGGVLMGDLEVFAHVSLANDAKDFAGNSVEGDAGYFVGAGYMMNNYKLFADWRMIGGEYQGVTTGGTKEDLDVSIIRIGAGRQERLNDRATLFAKAMVVRQHAEDDGAGYANVWATTDLAAAGEETTYTIPLTVGLEYAATSWLDLRASVVQNVWSDQDTNNKGTAPARDTKGNVAATSVSAGASLKFGEFAVDGLVSTNNAGNGAGANNDGSVDSAGALRTDELMTRVSMIYRF